MRPDKKPARGACRKEHAARSHTCPADDYRGGGRYRLHSPIQCVNCNNLHSSTNPRCPASSLSGDDTCFLLHSTHDECATDDPEIGSLGVGPIGSLSLDLDF